MPSRATFTGKDYGSETTNFSVLLPTTSSANYDAAVTSVNAIQTAVNGIAVGDFTGKRLNSIDVPVGAKSTDTDAQRERKWLVSYADPTDPIGNGSFEIGMADSSLLVADGENLNMSSGAGLAFKTAIEANCVSRLGNPIVIQSAKLVGRNT
jgi:hypothetical protein